MYLKTIDSHPTFPAHIRLSNYQSEILSPNQRKHPAASIQYRESNFSHFNLLSHRSRYFLKVSLIDANLSKHFTGQIQPTQQSTENLSNRKRE